MKRYLITSALPYANGPIHFGHIAGVYLPADLYTRHLRLKKEKAIHICGSDEHGVAIMQNAQKAKESYQAYVNKWHKEHKDLFDKYEIKFDPQANFDEKSIDEIIVKYDKSFEKFELNSAIESAWNLIQLANQFIDITKPWSLAKTSPDELPRIMNELWNLVVLISERIYPFLPGTSEKIREIFLVNKGEKITESPKILFPKKYLHTEEPKRK